MSSTVFAFDINKRIEPRFNKGKTPEGQIGKQKMVFIKGGCYQMGDTFGEGGSDEKPVHEVCVDDFYLGKHELTQSEWREIMGHIPSGFKFCGKTALLNVYNGTTRRNSSGILIKRPV